MNWSKNSFSQQSHQTRPLNSFSVLLTADSLAIVSKIIPLLFSIDIDTKRCKKKTKSTVLQKTDDIFLIVASESLLSAKEVFEGSFRKFVLDQ